jgi:short chain dehydrogenase
LSAEAESGKGADALERRPQEGRLAVLGTLLQPGRLKSSISARDSVMSRAPSSQKDHFAREADETAASERAIQNRVDRADEAGGEKKKKKPQAMQAGARRYPVPPLPEQHLAKPGLEEALALAPMYDAPHYKGSEKLAGKIALITGGDSGIGRAVAVLYTREGADVAVAYLNEHEDAEETKRAVENEGRRCILISGDVADPAFCRDAVARTVTQLGGLDILVNNAAFRRMPAS